MRTALREVLPGRDTPVTSLTLIVLLVTTLVLRFGVCSDIDALEWASTNIINLQTHPVRALFASIFVTSGWGAAVGIVLALTGPALERRAGHLRVLLIPLVAHIVATLATEGGLRAAIWAHSTPTSHAFQLDIGTSYVAYAAGARCCATSRGDGARSTPWFSPAARSSRWRSCATWSAGGIWPRR